MIPISLTRKHVASKPWTGSSRFMSFFLSLTAYYMHVIRRGVREEDLMKPTFHLAYSFETNFRPISDRKFQSLLRKHKLDPSWGLYLVGKDYNYEPGPCTLNLYGCTWSEYMTGIPLASGIGWVRGRTVIGDASGLDGEGFGIRAFLALLEGQKSIPREARQNIIVCETAIVGKYGWSCLLYAIWCRHRHRWVADTHPLFEAILSILLLVRRQPLV